MTKTLTKLAAIGLMTIATHAVTINSTGVVGIIEGTLANANPTTGTAAAQHLLDMLANTQDPALPAAAKFRTSSTEYAGAPSVVLGLGTEIINPGQDTDMNVGAGHDYVLAKYDGTEGGYVLWALNDLAFTVPGKSAANGVGLWSNGKNDGKGLSHILVFDATVSVPDGGATVALLGVGILGLGAMRRKLS
jgi:hypothetical protein